MQFPFGPLSPDAGETIPGICLTAENVLPLPVGYGPMRGLTVPATATALAAGPKGIISLVKRDGTWAVFGATSSDWYNMGADYTFGASIASGFALTSGDHWSFLHFGAQLLGTNTTDGMYAYNVETPAGASVITAAGKPRFIFSCANVVIGLDCLDNNGVRDNRLIRNSAINDHTDWVGEGADYQPLESGGALICGCDVKGNTAVIFQERAISVMQFGNAPGSALYSLYKLVDGTGSVGARSMVPFNTSVYFLATDGFCRYTVGAQDVERIGAGKIDQWFLSRVDQANLDEVQGSVDPLNKIIWWRWLRQGNSTDVFVDMIGYNWQYDRWVTSDEETSYLTRIATPGYVLDAMDAFGVLDSITTPLDDRFWQGGQPVFAALDADYKFGTFSGANKAAIIETSLQNSPVTGLVTRATPIDDATAGTTELGIKAQLSDSVTWKAGVAKGTSGRVALRGRGMNIAFRRNITASATWTYATGIDHVQAETGGPK
jgi:hypothetical protein